MNIEIKPNIPDLADKVIDLLIQYNAIDGAVISSFQRPVISSAIQRGVIGVGQLYSSSVPVDFASFVANQRAIYGQVVHKFDTVNIKFQSVAEI